MICFLNLRNRIIINNINKPSIIYPIYSIKDSFSLFICLDINSLISKTLEFKPPNKVSGISVTISVTLLLLTIPPFPSSAIKNTSSLPYQSLLGFSLATPSLIVIVTFPDKLLE